MILKKKKIPLNTKTENTHTHTNYVCMRIFPLAEYLTVNYLDGLCGTFSINKSLQAYLKAQGLGSPLTIPSGYHNSP